VPCHAWPCRARPGHALPWRALPRSCRAGRRAGALPSGTADPAPASALAPTGDRAGSGSPAAAANSGTPSRPVSPSQVVKDPRFLAAGRPRVRLLALDEPADHFLVLLLGLSEDVLTHHPHAAAVRLFLLDGDEVDRQEGLVEGLGEHRPVEGQLVGVAVAAGVRLEPRQIIARLDVDDPVVRAEPPTVTVEAAYSKHRREDVQPIRRDLAAILGPWLKGKQPGKPVFKMPDKPVKLIRADLTAAREAWLKEAPSEKVRKEREKASFLKYRDAAGRVADFHALRHTYISRLVRSGANIKVAQELARHSTPTLTLGRYAHVQLVDQTRALDALPAIPLHNGDGEPAQSSGSAEAGVCA